VEAAEAVQVRLVQTLEQMAAQVEQAALVVHQASRAVP
jgi:hypothetical protein